MMESLIYECAALGLDVLLFSFFYKLYKDKSRSAKAVMEAPSFEIDSSLPNKVKNNGNVVQYAVISGIVRASSAPLHSQYLSNIKGVIRKKVVREHKMRWSPMLRSWNAVEREIQLSFNSVPFSLVGKGGWFKTAVEVVNPLSAEELEIPTVYDNFTAHQGSLGESVVGFFRGERTTGIQDIESMLSEGVILTAVGELTVENEVLKIKPPSSSGVSYFLTTLSVDSLVKKMTYESKFYKALSAILGCVGFAVAVHLITKYYSVRKRRIEQAQQREAYREAQRLRRLADPSRTSESENSRNPLCVICLTNPVEIIILECGHACMCIDCSECVRDLCPVCRAPIDRMAPTYLP